MSESMTGGCLCGAVRYTVSGEAIFAGRCYCEDCRKTSGSGHTAMVAFPEAAVSIEGALTDYTKNGGSGQPITRRFCPTCGSRVVAVASVLPGMVMIAASTLDQPEKFSSQMSVYASRAPSWDKPPADAPAFPEMPPQ